MAAGAGDADGVSIREYTTLKYLNYNRKGFTCVDDDGSYVTVRLRNSMIIIVVMN